MANNAEQKPSFEELLADDAEKPAFEEMLSAEQPKAAMAPQSLEMEPAEIGLRAVRQSAKGGTFGASEFLYGGTAGTLGIVNDLINKKDFESAEKLLNSFKDYYKQDIESQEKFGQKYPLTSLGSELVGGVLTGGAGAGKVAAGEAIATIPQILKESIKVGAAGSAAYKAGELAYKAPYEKKTLPEQAKEIGEAGVFGAAAGPVITTGMGVAAAVPYLGAKAIEKIGTSKPVLAILQTIMGPKSDIMKKWYSVEREIGKLPDVEAVSELFDDVKSIVTEQKITSEKELDRAIENLRSVEQRVDEAAAFSAGAQKDKLEAAKNNLKVIQEDLLNNKRMFQQEASVAKKELSKQLVDPSMGPYVNTVEDSLKELQTLITTGSEKARDAIDPEFRYSKQKIIDYAKTQFNNIGVQGTGAALTDSAVTAQSKLSAFMQRIESKLPEEVNGWQLKDILKQIDTEIETLTPGRYGSDTERAFYNLRRSVDQDLKVMDPYREAMKPVAEMRSFLEQATNELSSPTRIESALRKAKENPRVAKIFQGLKNYTGVDLEQPIVELQKAAQLRMPGALAAQQMGLPSVQDLAKTTEILELTRMQNFKEKVFTSLGQTPLGNAIISLRTDIEKLGNPNFRRALVEADVAEGRTAVMGAALAREQAELLNTQAVERAKQFLKYEKGGQAVQTILRAPLNSEESVKATQLIEAMSKLPDQEFAELFNSINLNKPSDFKRFAELFRLEEAISRPYTQGSRRVQMVKAIGRAVGSALGYENAGLIGSGLGAFLGGYIDTAGPAITKMYLKGLSRATGLPTLPKLEALSPVPITPELRNLAKLQLSEMISGLELDKFSFVDQSKVPYVIEDIQKSDLSSVEKAKAISSLSNTQTLSNRIMQKIVMAGEKLSTGKPLGLALAEKAKPETLAKDKPDVLRAMQMLQEDKEMVE